MRSIQTILVIAVLAALLPAYPDKAEACGPEFEVSILSDRSNTMMDMPGGVFTEQVRALVPAPKVQYRVVQEGGANGPIAGESDAERELYDKGSALFGEGRTREAAIAYSQLLELPSMERQTLSTWAAYMVGRSEDNGARVVQAYQQVRSLVAQGYRDDLGLAASSLGQEARLHLGEGWPFFSEPLARDLEKALLLYGEQAAIGHQAGATSLLLLARAAVANDSLTEISSSSVGRGLMAVYLYTRRFELSESEAQAIFESLVSSGSGVWDSKLAATAYREGKWEIAERLATQSSSAWMSTWVLSKIALRQGKKALAEELIAKLSNQSITPFAHCDEDMRPRLRSEAVIWALQEGRALDAMKLAWTTSESMSDYIAERVLSRGELRVFLVSAQEGPRPGTLSGPVDWDGWQDQRVQSLRGIFARRLMRSGYIAVQEERFLSAVRHFDEAVHYFEDKEAANARQLSRWILQAEINRDPIVRADALYRASTIAREHGMEILATADAPDWGVYGGSFDLSDYLESDADGEWMSTDEKSRLTSSAPRFDERYHYRRLASELAEQAADILPTQSQAFAAALCHSTRYVFNTDRPRVARLWKRYVEVGPTVDFASEFGQRCPEPEFVAARKYLQEPSRKWPWLLGALAGLLALLAAFQRFRTISIRRTQVGDLDQRLAEDVND